MPALAERSDVIAPDIVGFGFTEAPGGFEYSLDAVAGPSSSASLDALGLDTCLDRRQQLRRRPGALDGGARSRAGRAAGADGGLRGVVPHHRTGSTGCGATARRSRRCAAARHVRVRPGLRDRRAGRAALRRPSTRPGSRRRSRRCSRAPRQRWVDAMVTPRPIAGLPHRTLVVHGRDDKVIPLEQRAAPARADPRGQLHVFGRCGHWTQIEHAEAFGRLVADFLG